MINNLEKKNASTGYKVLITLFKTFFTNHYQKGILCLELHYNEKVPYLCRKIKEDKGKFS